MMKRTDKIILRNKPKNWNLTIQFDVKGTEALDYKYPEEKDYDHVIYCSAGNGMHKPFGKKAWNKLKNKIECLAEEEARKVNVVLCGTDEFWASKMKDQGQNKQFLQNIKEVLENKKIRYEQVTDFMKDVNIAESVGICIYGTATDYQAHEACVAQTGLTDDQQAIAALYALEARSTFSHA